MAKSPSVGASRRHGPSTVALVREHLTHEDSETLAPLLVRLLRELGTPLARAEAVRLFAALRLLRDPDEGVVRDGATLLVSSAGEDMLRGLLDVAPSGEMRQHELIGHLVRERDADELVERFVRGGGRNAIKLLSEGLRSVAALDAGDLQTALIESLCALAACTDTETLLAVLHSCSGRGAVPGREVAQAAFYIVAAAQTRTAHETVAVALAWAQLTKRATRSGSPAQEAFELGDLALTRIALVAAPDTRALDDHPGTLVLALARFLSCLNVAVPTDLPAPDISLGGRSAVSEALGHLRDVVSSKPRSGSHLVIDAVQCVVWGEWLQGDPEKAFALATKLHVEHKVRLAPCFGLLPIDAALAHGRSAEFEMQVQLGAAHLLSTKSISWDAVERRIVAVLGAVPEGAWPLGPDLPGMVHDSSRVTRIIQAAARLRPDQPLAGALGAVVAEYEARGDRPPPVHTHTPAAREEELAAEEAPIADISVDEETVIALLADGGPSSLPQALDVRDWILAADEADLAREYRSWVLSERGSVVLSDQEVLQEIVALEVFGEEARVAHAVRETLWRHVGRRSYQEVRDLVIESRLVSADDVLYADEEHTRRSENLPQSLPPERINPVRILFVGGNEVQAAYFEHLEQELEQYYGGRVTVEWVDQTWGSNWQVVAARVDRRLPDCDVVCIMTFVRTMLGARIRRLADRHEVPWVGVTGHGRASLLASLHRAVEVADRLADG